MAVKFRKQWFNPLYFIIKELQNAGITEVYVYGGKSSAKTVTICQFIAIENLLRRDNALVYRKESVTIKTTVKESMKLAIDNCRLTEGFTVMDFLCRSVHGNEINFKGLDKEDKAKGIENVGMVLMDELNHFSKGEYDQLLLSFRGQTAKMFFATWNPVSEDSWIKKDIIDADTWQDWEGTQLPCKTSFVRVNKQGNRALIKTTYIDNYWTVGSPCGTYGYRDEALLAKYENLKYLDIDSYNINVLGEWGIIKPESLYIEAFNGIINVGKPILNIREVVLVGLDFNIGNSAVVGQIFDYQRYRFKINILNEFHLSGGENEDLESLCEKIVKKYGKYDIYFTGDASGNSGSALTEASKGGNALALKYLKKYTLKYWGHERVFFKKFSSNPQTSYSGWVINLMFKVLADDFLIHEDCTILKRDLNKVEKITGGGLNKDKCNKGDYGHVLDAMRYLIHAFGLEIWKIISKDIDIPEHFKRANNQVN